VLLMLGLASRLTGLVLTGNMLVAYVTAERPALLDVFSDPGTFYQALPFTFLFAALLVLIFGAGWFALDTLIAHRWTTGEAEQGHSPLPVQRDAA
jgi:putative oxidoreductase